MKLLVAIPALNEEATIREVIEKIPRDISGIDRTEVLVVDDGSSDDTAALARRAGASVVSHPVNLGVGVAFQTSMRQAIKRGADVLVTIDGDGQFDPADIPALVAPILSGEATACTASRFSDPSVLPDMSWVKKWGNRRVAELVTRLSGRRIFDASCGYRAYSREALLGLTVHHTFTYTQETLLDLAAKNLSVKEVPLRVRGRREHGESRVAKNVVKYALRAGLIMLRFYRDHHPLALLATFGGGLFIPGALLLAYSVAGYLRTNTWVKWAAFSGAGLLGIAIGVVFLGFVIDIVSRLRRNQEEILYWLRARASTEVVQDGSAPTARAGSSAMGDRR